MVYAEELVFLKRLQVVGENMKKTIFSLLSSPHSAFVLVSLAWDILFVFSVPTFRVPDKNRHL